MSTSRASWLQSPIRAVLMDISGVLYERFFETNISGTTHAIDGSVEALQKLRQAKMPFRLVTNETQLPVCELVKKLNSFGFDLKESEVIAPAKSVRRYLEKLKLSPFLLVHPGLMPEFEGIDTSNPNCVVVGDAAEDFTYDKMNKSFNLLLRLKSQTGQISLEHARSLLITMGKGKYYQEKGELMLDLGAYTAALEYATDVPALVIGKPSLEYFRLAIDSMSLDNLNPAEVVMIGDDIIGDVKGAQDAGMRGVQVKTGKFRLSDLQHPKCQPDSFVDNLLDGVKQIVDRVQSQ